MSKDVQSSISHVTCTTYLDNSSYMSQPKLLTLPQVLPHHVSNGVGLTLGKRFYI